MPDGATYTSRSTALRDTSKWIAAAFTGSGAVFFSALTFTNLQQIGRQPNWLLILGLGAVPVLMAALAIYFAARVVTQQPPSVGAMFPKFGERRHLVSSHAGSRATVDLGDLVPVTVAVYGSTAGFDEEVVAAIGSLERRAAAAEKDHRIENEKALDNARSEVERLQSGLQEILACAEYVRVRNAYRVAGWVFLGAALVSVTAASAAGTLTALNASDPTVTAAAITAPIDVTVWLPGAISHGAGPSGCPIWDGMRAVAVGGTVDQPYLVFPAATSGPAQHPGPDRADCREPWAWAVDRPGVVTVVPVARPLIDKETSCPTSSPC